MLRGVEFGLRLISGFDRGSFSIVRRPLGVGFFLGKRGSRPAVLATCPILFRSSDAVFVIGLVYELCIEVFNT